MPGCPQCGRQWPDGYQRCPDDGTLLAMVMTGGGTALEVASPVDDELPVGSHAGDYQIERKIGEGGMGSVYGARHPLIGKRAAIKVIKRELSSSREAVDRFVLEAQSVNQIGHPNIVDVFGFGQLHDGRSYFIMEWLQGESLRERLQRSLSFAEALDILESIAKALQAAHEAGVVHRDLKPDNVFLASIKGEKPQVKLLDFGLAKLTGADTQRFDRTRTGVVMGTPLYLSPEQAKGVKIDAATDVYSLAAMAYEMLSGVVPFKADSAVEIMAMHISNRATPLSQIAPWVPPEINALVLEALEKDPRARPTAAQMRERFAACRASAGAATGSAMSLHSQSPAFTPAVGAPSAVVAQQTPPITAAPITQAPVQSGGGKRIAFVFVLLALLGGGIGFALFLVLGNKAAPQKVASSEPAAAPSTPATAPSTPATAPTTTPATAPTTPAPSPTPAPTDKPAAAPPSPTPAPTDVVKTVKTEPRPAPRKAKLAVSFDGPPRALVIVDGKPYGRELAGRVTIEVAPGEHAIRVQAKGYKPAETNVKVEAGATKDIQLTLEQRKQGVNAVHDPFAE